MTPGVRVGRLALQPLFQVYLRVPLLLVAPGELASALVAAERLLAGVRSDVGRQVVAPGERSHANATLERLLAGVNSNVPGELVAPGEPPVAPVDGAGVRTLVDRSLARSIRILSRLYRDEPERQSALLVNLREDLVTLRRAGVVLGQLNAGTTGRWWLLLLSRLRLLLLLNVAGSRRFLLQRRFLVVVMGMMVEEVGIVSFLVRG